MSESQAIVTQAASTPTEPKPVESESQSEAAKRNLNIRVAPETFQKYTVLRTKFGLETNEQLLDRLIQESEQVPILRQKLAQETKAVEEIKYEDYRRELIAIPEILVPLIWRIREGLKVQGYDTHFSTAVNVCVLHFILYMNKFQVTKDEYKVLDDFLRLGPASLNLEALNRFLQDNFKLETEGK